MANVSLNLKKSHFVPKLYPYLLDYSHRWEFWVGSAGSGKSFTICQKLIIRCCKEKIRILVCRRYASTLRNSVVKQFRDVLSQWKLTKYVKIRETDFTITFPNGSEVIFTGLDDEEKLLSLTDVSTIWIEESFQVERNKVEQLNLRMRGAAANQQLILSWNPISKQSWLYNFTVENPPNNSIYIHSIYKHNPFLSKEYVAALDELETRNPQKYRIFGLGEWGIDSEGLIYNNFKIEDFDYTQINGVPLCGLDFGFIHDLSAFTASLMVEDEKKIYVFAEWGDRGKTNSELADIITSLGFSKSIIIADSSEPKSIEEMKRLGIQRIRGAVKGPDSILHGIQKLQNYQIIVHPTCEGVIRELETYCWQKDKHTDMYINKPVDADNHYMDSLRYSLQCVGSKLKTLDKNLF